MAKRLQTYHDIYNRLRQQDWGTDLLAFDQLPLPPQFTGDFVQQLPMWLLIGNFQTERIHFVSDNVTELTGHLPEDFLDGGVPWAFGLLHPDDVDLIVRGSKEIVDWLATAPDAQRRSHAMLATYRLRNGDGTYTWWQAHQVGLYYTATGALLYFANWATDVNAIYRLSVPTCRLQYTDASGKRITVPMPSASTANPLTTRELEVLRLVVTGQTSQDISERLSISKTTVDTHRHHILEKLNCRNSVDLTQMAIAMGLV